MTKFPSFFVVGTQKAGTTTLHNWLQRQPDVCLPTLKETHFFSSERFEWGLDWYLSQFPRNQPGAVVGETDPDYMFFEEVPYRIRNTLGPCKFVFIFREPISRAYSQYQMSVRRGFEDLTFFEALLAEEGRLADKDNRFSLRHHSYLARGRYVEQVCHYHNVFPDADFLFIRFDDMISPTHGKDAYEAICKFIGLESLPRIVDVNEVFNAASVPRFVLLRDFLYDPSFKENWLRRVFARAFKNRDLKRRIAVMLDRFNQKTIRRTGSEQYDIGIPLFVVDQVSNQIAELEALTNLDLDPWLDRVRQYDRTDQR